MVKKTSNKKDNTLSILTHILGIFTYALGPLIVYLFAKDKDVKIHAKNALNWQISFTIYVFAIFLFSFISIITKVLIPNVYFLFPFSFVTWILMVSNIIFSIIGAIKANEGIFWKYPLSLNLIKN